MQYINPFNLLEIKSNDLFEIDSSIIRRAKRNLLAEIELNEGLTIEHDGKELTKSDCIRAIDELDDKDKREFHFFIYQNNSLSKFLSDGCLNFFKAYKVESIYKLPEFLDFISPYFSFQYNMALLKAFRNKNYDDVFIILSVKPITNEQYFEKCYRGTYAFIREFDDELNRLFSEIERRYSSEVDFNRQHNLLTNLLPEHLDRIRNQVAISVKRMTIHLKSELDVNSVNLLPSYFQSIRNQLANSIKKLAIHLNNDPYSLYEPAYRLIEIANNITIDGLVRQSVTKNFYTIKGNYNEFVQKQTTPIVPQTIVKKEATIKPETVEKKTFSENTTTEDQKNNKSSRNIYAGFLLCIAAFFLWGFFNRTVQTVVLSLSALMYGIWFYNHLKKPNEYHKQREIQTGIYTISGVICICGFFVQMLAILFLSYMLVSFLHLCYNAATSRKSEKPIAGLGYLAIAICITAFWQYSNQPVEPIVSSPSAQEEKLLFQSYDSTSTSAAPLINTPSASNSPIDSTTSNFVFEPSYEKVAVKNGNLPECSFTSKYNKQLNNKLVISTISSDAAIKIYNYETDECVRYIFINKGTTYTVRNIPEGRYYLKIAYGNDWSVMQGDPICRGKFLSDVLYKRGSEILDFNLHYTNDGYQVPSYSLTLTTTFTFDKYHERSENEISEKDFYNN